MATQTTEHDYPPLDSVGIHTFIESQGGTLTGDINTDFRNALFILVEPGGKANDYSIDDLWQRHVIANISGDANAAAGNPAAAGRGKSGFVGNKPQQYYDHAFLKNPGNANDFPGAVNPLAQSWIVATAAGVAPPAISNGGRTVTFQDDSTYNWAVPDVDTWDKDVTVGDQKYMFEVTVDDYQTDQQICFGWYDPAQAVASTDPGNLDGGAAFVTPTIFRGYRGPSAGNFDALTSLGMESGDVITITLNFATEKVTMYINGVAGSAAKTLWRTTPISDFVRPVIKAYKDPVISINPVILYPVDGFEAWR